MIFKKIVFILCMCTLFTKTVQAQDSTHFNFQVGKMEVYLLMEQSGQGKTEILIDANKEILKECAPKGSFPNAINSFLIKDEGTVILVDAGLGPNILKKMESLDVFPYRVQYVLLTHLHGDHIGAMLDKEGKPVFRSAEVFMSKAEYEYWMNDRFMSQAPENRKSSFQKARKIIEAYRSQLFFFDMRTLEEEPALVLPGIRGIAAPGHTPGHCMYLLESEEESLLIWGDLTHAMAVQMPYPEIAVTYDSDPERAIITRLQILEYVSDHLIPVAGMHIPYPGMGFIEKSEENGYDFLPLNEE